MRLLLMILLVTITMSVSTCGVYNSQLATEFPPTDLLPDTSKNILSQITEPSHTDGRLPFVYVNEVWYPWFGASNLDDYPYDSIKNMVVKNDEYGNRAIYVEYPDCIVDSIKNTKSEYFINLDPSVIFNEGRGSDAKMIEWINTHKIYPDGFRGKKTVVVTFVINLNGTVSEVTLFKECDNNEINQDAIRLIEALPRFEVIYHTPYREPIKRAIRLRYEKH